MKIAYICADPGIPVFGFKGCSIHVQAVVTTLLQMGHEVVLFAGRLGGTKPDLPGLTVYRLPAVPRGKGQQALFLRERATLGNNLDLRLALERLGPFDLVYERYALWSYTAMDYARSQGIPGILEVNAPLIEEQAVHRGLLDRTRALWSTTRVFEAATGIVAVSETVADYLRQYPLGQGPIQVIPNGVDPNRFPTDLSPTCPSTQFTLGFVGTMKPWHDLSTLMTGFADFHRRVPESRLLMVGQGPMQSAMVEQAKQLGCVASVHFTGAVSPAEIPGLLASMDVAVAPYPFQESCYFSPLKVYEYMAAGLPVVASAIGQLTGLIQPGKTGLLYAPGDIAQLVDCLEKLLLHPELRQTLGQAARAQVLKHHTWRGVVEQILTLAEQAWQCSLEVAS